MSARTRPRAAKSRPSAPPPAGMRRVSLANGAWLAIWKTIAPGRCVADSALTAVKLTRYRTALFAEWQAVTRAFDEAAQRHAVRRDDQPVVAKRNGAPQVYGNTGTPAYEMLPDAEVAFAAEGAALLAEQTEVTAPLFTAADLAVIHLTDAAKALGDLDLGAAFAPLLVDDAPEGDD